MLLAASVSLFFFDITSRPSSLVSGGLHCTRCGREPLGAARLYASLGILPLPLQESDKLRQIKYTVRAYPLPF